jgi:rhodanese-related sulfurtransferase/glyoxylase-like metal-dependent hydrolase (beta-lactamase superfamily II)
LHFHQFYLACLAHASYLIGDDGVCAIVDPQRDVDHYVEEAERRGLEIRYVLETHLHADFVSGHRELAQRTGAEIVIGAKAGAEFPHRAVREGDVLRLGDLELRALETPGHTPESISWLLVENGVPRKVLTGDTLFIGDVGRPDLAGGRGYTPQQMAEMLHDSLHTKLLALPDEVEVWPAHGAGSACGRNISKETSSTIGIQRLTNYALRPMPREEFVAMMTADLPEAPPYFPLDAAINRSGARPLAEIEAPPLSPQQVRAAAGRGALILDVRDSTDFCNGHLPDAINIGLGGQFASWAGSLLPFDRPVVVVADGEERSREAVVRLARVGLENIAGWLAGGVLAWSAAGYPLVTIGRVDVAELRERLERTQVIDVRRPGEYASGHVPHARHVPLSAQLPDELAVLDRNAPLAVVCQSGYRSSTAVSLLARAGFTNVENVIGGTAAWVSAGFATES